MFARPFLPVVGIWQKGQRETNPFAKTVGRVETESGAKQLVRWTENWMDDTNQFTPIQPAANSQRPPSLPVFSLAVSHVDAS